MALAGIVARETMTGEFSGSMSGVGLSSDGVSVGGGSIHGGSTTTSHRAQQFLPPPPQAIEPSDDEVILCVMLMFCSLFIGIAGKAWLSSIGLNGTEMFGMLGYVPPVLGCILFLIGLARMLQSANRKPDPAIRKAYLRAVKLDKTAVQVHGRLRYCEVDHIVYDPITKESAHAELDPIHRMVRRIASC